MLKVKLCKISGIVKEAILNGLLMINLPEEQEIYNIRIYKKKNNT